MVPVSGSAPSARAGSAPLQLSPPGAGPRASGKGSALAPAPGASALRSPVTGSPSPSVPCLRSRTAGLLPCRELHWDSPALRSQFGGHTQKPPLGRLLSVLTLTGSVRRRTLGRRPVPLCAGCGPRCSLSEQERTEGVGFRKVCSTRASGSKSRPRRPVPRACGRAMTLATACGTVTCAAACIRAQGRAGG